MKPAAKTRGGFRPGAGRKKGTVTKRTLLKRKALEDAKRLLGPDLTPIAVMAEAMREAYLTMGAILAHEFAKDLAPYMHPRLQNIQSEVQGDFTVVLNSFAAQHLLAAKQATDSADDADA